MSDTELQGDDDDQTSGAESSGCRNWERVFGGWEAIAGTRHSAAVAVSVYSPSGGWPRSNPEREYNYRHCFGRFRQVLEGLLVLARLAQGDMVWGLNIIMEMDLILSPTGCTCNSSRYSYALVAGGTARVCHLWTRAGARNCATGNVTVHRTMQKGGAGTLAFQVRLPTHTT